MAKTYLQRGLSRFVGKISKDRVASEAVMEKNFVLTLHYFLDQQITPAKLLSTQPRCITMPQTAIAIRICTNPYA